MDVAVYVHFPWCLQRCPYCDFATEAVAPRAIPHGPYAAAVTSELALRGRSLGDLRAATLFFGGGTPSLWEPSELGRVVRAVEALGAPDEVTVECNPTSLTEARASALRDHGVTRLSVGVQSLRDRHLRYLGRLHDAAGALRAVSLAVASGLRVSADLMYGLDAQPEEELVEDALALLDLGVEHLSCYALTVEPSTRFGELARKGRLPRATDDHVAGLYLALEGALSARGLEHYEVSNYALPGARARHNVAYWRGMAYLGLGAGAVGCVPEGASARRWRNLPDPAAYASALGDGALPPAEEERLDPPTRVREALLLGLRCADGTDLAGLRRATGLDPLEGRRDALARALERGNVARDGDVLRIPRARWLLADDITAGLF
ncbi:MAG: radical SAM family heme chaperone HemW [Deltaproteobacteria bacterium]|nr:radical SAM family heme chaperone HemW [Deltaproteobacteria bacterium]